MDETDRDEDHLRLYQQTIPATNRTSGYETGPPATNRIAIPAQSDSLGGVAVTQTNKPKDVTFTTTGDVTFTTPECGESGGNRGM